MGMLLLPRRAWPDAVPLPLADRGALAHVAAADHALAEKARHSPLPPAVRALGSAIREFHVLEAQGAAEGELALRRRAIAAALPDAAAGGDEPLLELRAVQLESFVAELGALQSRGAQSEELVAVSGSFVRGMQYEGWYDGERLLATDGALRTMFKEMWNGLAGVDVRPAFKPSLDEERALYALYLRYPHPARAARETLAAARRGARDAAACAALAEAERAATESWRLERIARFAAIDPLYPAAYARGVAHLRRGDPTRAAMDLTAWLRDHPEGPLTLRARTYLRVALDGARIE